MHYELVISCDFFMVFSYNFVLLLQVKECRKYLDFPEVISGELEPNASFWCHFCEMEIPKHVTNRTFSIKFGGVFEHFAR